MPRRRLRNFSCLLNIDARISSIEFFLLLFCLRHDLATSERALVDQIKSNWVNIALISVFLVSVDFGKSRASQLYSTAAIMMMMMLGGRVPMCVCVPIAIKNDWKRNLKLK